MCLALQRPASNEGEAKFKHPELTQFKLEKQAKILGKYGGQPALGAGLVLSRLPRDSILKATGSPAAREIQYSRVEQQDARHLAPVMQFKPVARDGACQSPWQAEVSGRRGPRIADESEEATASASSTSDNNPFASELTGETPVRATHTPCATTLYDLVTSDPQTDHQHTRAKLLQRRAVVTAACTPPPATKSSSGSGTPGGELAELLRRRQSMAAPMEPGSPTTPQPTLAHRGAALPTTPELAEVLQRRATPNHVDPTAPPDRQGADPDGSPVATPDA
ncbi:MAG: hypothetical protein WDW36_009288 [Sanguina aurantia]